MDSDVPFRINQGAIYAQALQSHSEQKLKIRQDYTRDNMVIIRRMITTQRPSKLD